MYFGVMERLSKFLNVQPFVDAVISMSALCNQCRCIERNVDSCGDNDDVYMHGVAKNLYYNLN